MACHVDEEECFENYFANEPKLQLHYFMINSLYNGNPNQVLDDRVLARQFRIKRYEVLDAVHEINKCSPEVTSFRQNFDYKKTIISEKGRNVLRHDITKLVPQHGIYLIFLKEICPNELMDEYFRNRWLDKYSYSSKEVIVRGEKYLEFVKLYNSLSLFDESDYVTNRKDLDEMSWIEMITGRYEIFRGQRFPSCDYEKLTFLYQLAAKMFDQNMSLSIVSYNSIQEQEKEFAYHKNGAVNRNDNIDKDITKYNVASYKLSKQRKTLLLMQKHINRLQQRGFSVPKLKELEISPKPRSSKKLWLPRPQIQLLSGEQIRDLEEQLQQHRCTFLPTLQQVQQQLEQQNQHQLQLMHQQPQQQLLPLSQLQQWPHQHQRQLPQQSQMQHLQNQPMQLSHHQPRQAPQQQQQQTREEKQLPQSQPLQLTCRSYQQRQQDTEISDNTMQPSTDQPSSSSVGVKLKKDES